MIYLKEANMEDAEKEYEFITQLPEDENGFMNQYYGCSYEEFVNKILPGYIEHREYGDDGGKMSCQLLAISC